MKRIAIKIGSNVLTRPNGSVDVTRMSSLVDQVADLHRQGMEIVLISSGAVASGKSEFVPDRKLDTVSARQLFSAIGQAKLMNRYYEFFQGHGLACGQVLTTKESFGTRMHYLNQKNCMETMLSNRVIPIVNENDTISVTELMFTDNDELSGLIATMLDMDMLILLSNVDGIYTGAPGNPTSEVIREIPANSRDLSTYIQASKSSFGRGGMLTKYGIAKKIALEGIPVVIANGKKEGILTDLFTPGANPIYTRFQPNLKPVSGIKKWLAHSQGFAKGEVFVNEGAKKVLLGKEASSILFVGITQIIGEFEKDDIVKIMTEDGQQLGIGKAACGNRKASVLIGQKDIKPFIHYDYLWIDEQG